MQCPGCGTENSARVKFCAECGAPIGIPCPFCAFRNARDATACGGCGRSLDASQGLNAERRRVTVVFADIAGSTALAESLDPEDLHELYSAYQTMCSEVLRRYEGHLAQVLGDGILAYFGYPAAHEDDAARAVYAALDILIRAGSINAGGNSPRVRVGIHTGLVVVGDTGGVGRREQLALGEAPNIAARLQSEALPDTIVISDATQKLLAGQFALEDLGSRTLKGLSRPLQIFRVIGKSEAATRFQAMKTARGLTPFVGREREVETIRAAWDEAAEGHGQMLLLRGEAGIGKSRLLEAASNIAGSRLHEVFEAECSPYQMNSPLNPIVELLERRMGIEKDMAPALKLDLIEQFAAGRGVGMDEATSTLAGFLSVPATGRYPEIEMEPAKRRQRMLAVLADLLLHAVGGLPVLLLIEDLHWADPSTIDLLGEIVARLSNRPALVVCTTRPEPSAKRLDQLHCREIHVEALPPEDTRALAASVVGRKPLPLPLLEELVSRTGGIPLFVEAVTRTIIEAGILRELEDRYELTGPLPPGLIPATVQDSLVGRIDRLGPDRAVAQVAATIGRESSFELLQSVLGKSAEAMAAAVRRLVELELVTENGTPPASTYTFKHALIQDAAYESILRKTRQEFHGKIAEVLITRFPDMAETKPELLARHFEGAGRVPEAIAAWMKAGEHSRLRYAARESVAYRQKALALIETLPEDDPGRLQSEMEAQLTLSQGLMGTIGWGSREVEVACIRARDLCQRLGNGPGLIQALMGMSTVYFTRGALPQALEASNAALQMALMTDNTALQLATRAPAGYSAYFMADFVKAREHAEQASNLSIPEKDRVLAATSWFACRNFLMMSLWFMGYPDQAEKVRSHAWGYIEGVGIAAFTAYALGHVILLHYAQRDRAAIASVAGRLLSISSEEGYLLWVAQARIYLGWVQAVNGDAEEGIAEMKAGLEAYRLTGSGLMTPQLCLMMAEAQMCAGRPGEALAALSKGLRHAEEFQEHVHEPELYRLRAEILIGQGGSTAGEASLRRAIEVAQAQQAKMLELRAALALAKLQRSQGRLAEARVLLQPLCEWFREGFDTPEMREAREIVAPDAAHAGSA